ncbi:MAG: TIGR03757 family integrating conjugative element protein [Gammaproteobacteria bacterium]|nr:TIGR03757 family integrating conjugative element protein [Gammaproteobacteria bacterium]
MNFSQFIATAFAALFSINMAHADSLHQEKMLVEVFTTTDWEVPWESVAGTNEAHKNIDVQSYELDGIQRFKAQLSSNLPTDPDQSKQIALQRIQQLDGQSTSNIQNAAVGLAKAIQYGVDRYPAIVFGGEVVVYGLTDLSPALDHYQAWQAENRL